MINEPDDDIARIILEDTLAGYWDWDVLKHTQYYSPRFKAILGYQNHEFIHVPESWQEVVHPDDLPLALEGYNKHVKSRGEIPFYNQVRCIHKNGSVIWVVCSGRVIKWDDQHNPLRVIGALINITPHKITEEALKISEERFRGAFEYSGIGMAILSIEGRWLKVNKKTCELLGYTEEELYSKNFQEITHPDYLESDLELAYKLIQGEIDTYQIEKQYIHKKGHFVWGKLSVSMVKDPEGKILHFVSQIEDITQHKQAEEKLQKINNELTALFNSGTQVSIIGADIEGTITHFNKGAEILLGYAKEEMIGKKTPEIIHTPEEIEKRSLELSLEFGREIKGFDVFVEYAKQGRYDSREWTYVRKNGSAFPVQLVVTAIRDEHKNITGFLGIATDISQIKETEKALRESEARWQFALEGSEDGVWDWNIEEGTVFFSNRWKSMLGYEPEEVEHLLEEWDKRVHPDDKEQCYKDLEKHFSGETPMYLNEHRLLCKDGTYKWILDRGKVTEWTTKGSPLRIIGTHTDISLQKEKEQDLKETIELITDQNKRLLNFAYIVSHNLKSHAGNFELILQVLDQSDDPKEQKDIMHSLHENSKRLSETIKNLTEVVNIQTESSIERKTIRLHEYIENTITSLSEEIRRHNVIVINQTEPDTSLNYNPSYLESILLNLITNSIKYRNPDIQSKVELSSYVENNKLVLEVKDNGLGVDLTKYGKQLFALYKTFHGNADAKGVGLFITKNQVEAMGGKITVESKVGEGTIFKVCF